MSSAEVRSGSKDSIYKGLYPIREVKQYYRREFVNNKALYLCLICDFKTWKYSQHIARHIHLKHIGIKELKCEEPNCGKTFKRPESLVQHQKNHLCGFGIDSAKMKDPNNVCGVKNIKKFYFRELDNDYYVFGCKWSGCEFVTNNSGSIRRHVHNQHLCPHAVATNGSSNGNSGDMIHRQMSPDSDNGFSINDVMQPMIEIIEMDVNPQSMSLAMNSCESDFNPFTISAVENEVDDNMGDQSSTGGLYSLKNYSDLFTKVLIDGQTFFRCNCTDFTTKNQITLVRHIWTHIGRNDFDCDINGCNAKFENENSLYKHKKTDHNSKGAKSDDQNSSMNTLNNFLDISEMASTMASTSGLNSNPSFDFTAFPQTLSALMNGSSSLNYNKTGGDKSAQTVAELLALQNMSQLFLKNDNSNANQNIPILPNNKNFDNIYANNLNFLDESISSIESLREDMTSGKSNGFKRSFGTDRNNSGLYSLKNYDKFYSKVKVNEELTYKCTVCGFCSRSQVSLIRHIWTHTGMNSFECDIPGCSDRFNSETELYRHRKTHTSVPISTTPPTIFPAINANIKPVVSTPVFSNGSPDMQKTLQNAIKGSAIRKIMESKPERGLYSLKKYENLYKKIQTDQGFKFVCNCGQFETKSQATLVRHIWEHQSSQRPNTNDSFENESNGFENMSQTSNEFEMSANESTGRRDSRSIDDEIEDIPDIDNEELIDNSANDLTEPQKSTTFKKLKTSNNKETTNGTVAQSSGEVSAEEVYLNSLIVEIEDRGYFCQWPECEYSEESRELVVSHIKQMHNNLGDSLMQTTLEVDEENDGSYEDSDPEHNFPLLQEFCESGEQNLNQFQCEYTYCNASFPSFESLIEHKKIHSDFNNSSDFGEDSIDEDQDSANSSGNGRTIKSWKSYSYNGKTSAQNADKYSDSVPQPDGSFLYKCKWINCGYQSPVRGNIIRHIRRHTGDKPFRCELSGCGRSFAYSTDVKQHQQKEH